MSNSYILVNAVFSGIISALGTVGNSVIILAFAMSPSLRTVNNVFVIQLAVVDIAKASIVLSMKVVNQARGSTSMNATLCPIFGMLRTVGSCQSALLLGMIALVRYYKVVRPDRFNVVFSMKRARCYSAAVVIWTLVLALMPVIGLGRYKYSLSHGACFVDWSSENIVFRSIYYVFNVGIPFPVLTFCYFKIFRVLKQHSRILTPVSPSFKRKDLPETARVGNRDQCNLKMDQPDTPQNQTVVSGSGTQSPSGPGKTSRTLSNNFVAYNLKVNEPDVRQNNASPPSRPVSGRVNRLDVQNKNVNEIRCSSDLRRRKSDFEIVITKVMFAIVVVYMICWIPATVINFLNLSKAVPIPDSALLLAVTLVDLKVCVNPLIYIFSSKRFRAHTIKLFKQRIFSTEDL